MDFTVVIPTFNRKELVLRAVQSAYDTQWAGIEIIVVDDGSTDGTEELVKEMFPEVVYFRSNQNCGPGAARDVGIQHASGTWTVLLDDDDMLRRESLATMARSIRDWPQAADFPCLQFAHAHGKLHRPFQVIQLADYLHGQISGEFVPVINTRKFLESGLRYPRVRVGGEHLLWFHVAKAYGIPSWADRVADLGSDAPRRLTSTVNQLGRSAEYANLSDLTISQFGSDILRLAPEQYLKHAIGAATYWMLAGNRRAASLSARKLAFPYSAAAGGFIVLTSLLPTALLHWMFRVFRSAAA